MNARPNITRLALVLLGFWTLTIAAAAKENVSRSNPYSIGPRIAVDVTGRSHVVWTEAYSSSSGDVFYASGLPGQGWSTPVQVSSGGQVRAESPGMCDVDVDASGRVFVFWVEARGVRLRIRTGGSWSEIYHVDTGEHFNMPKINVDPQGNAFMIWNTGDIQVYSRALIGNSWEAIQHLSSSAKYGDLGVGRDVVYASFMYKSGGYYKTYYVWRGKGFGNGWSRPQRVPSDSGIEDEFQVIECDGMDRAHAMFAYYLDGARAMAANSQSPSGNWLSTVWLSEPQLIHDPSSTQHGNNIFVCWQIGGWGNGDAVLYSCRVDGGWSGPHYVPDTGGSTNSDVAADPSGATLRFVWDAYGEIWYGTAPVVAGGGKGGGGGGGGGGAGIPPVARLSCSTHGGLTPLTVYFDGSASTDDGSITHFLWDFGDGVFGEGSKTHHTYNRGGNFPVRLIVTDNEGLTGTAGTTIEVLEPNKPPVADFSFSPGTGLFPIQVQFDGTLSRDPDGHVVAWAWDFGDGGTASGPQPMHQFQTWGTFLVRLTIRDNRGDVASRTIPYTVLRLLQPLNIRWETSADESLFLTRYVTDIRWDHNPANDAISPVIADRVFRKPAGAAPTAYVPVAQLPAGVGTWRDYDTGGVGLYEYTVTSINPEGRESPIMGASQTLEGGSKTTPDQNAKPSLIRRIFRLPADK